MTVGLRGLGDAQADCDAMKRLDPITPGVFVPCTPALPFVALYFLFGGKR